MENNKNLHATAPTKYVAANGINYAYRHFGNSSGVPLICFQHFRGTMDDWDPMITDGLSVGRPVIIFNNTGISTTAGKTPDNVNDMAKDAIAFINALGLTKVDLLGFSLGGFIAQEIIQTNPDLIRKAILVGTSAQGTQEPEMFPAYLGTMAPFRGEERFLSLFFGKSAAARAKGDASSKRIMSRTVDRDPNSSDEVKQAQTKAITNWLSMKTPRTNPQSFNIPVFIVNGSNDEMMHTINSLRLFEEISNALLSLYPDAGHGSLMQYPELFVNQATFFLDSYQ